ncbi:MAG: MarR family transcriptional regulator [Ligilactobacillus acidipiscis]|jgi:DNA-binding MarR family transcriptional regulator|nr:MarR family transcriptional regulator [Ligilactobacillus acidipiscis]
MAKQGMELANQLCFSIYNANRLFAKFYQQTLDEYKLTYPQYLVLLALWEKDQRNLHDLGKTLHLASNTLTPLLRRLENTGWITRVHPLEDKRQLVVSLTEMGKKLKPQIEEKIAHCIKDVGEFSVEDYQKLLTDNQKLIKSLLKLV